MTQKHYEQNIRPISYEGVAKAKGNNLAAGSVYENGGAFSRQKRKMTFELDPLPENNKNIQYELNPVFQRPRNAKMNNYTQQSRFEKHTHTNQALVQKSHSKDLRNGFDCTDDSAQLAAANHSNLIYNLSPRHSPHSINSNNSITASDLLQKIKRPAINRSQDYYNLSNNSHPSYYQSNCTPINYYTNQAPFDNSQFFTSAHADFQQEPITRKISSSQLKKPIQYLNNAQHQVILPTHRHTRHEKAQNPLNETFNMYLDGLKKQSKRKKISHEKTATVKEQLDRDLEEYMKR